MFRPATSLAALVALALVASTVPAEAGGCNRVQPVPTFQPIEHITPAPARPWHFGMSLQLGFGNQMRGLQVYSVTPNSPAWRAGLEPGDLILSSNGQRFDFARSNSEGVDLLQRSVGGGFGGPVPTTAISTRVVPQSASASLQVLDVRTGQVTWVQVFPQPTGAGPIGGPVPTATAMLR